VTINHFAGGLVVGKDGNIKLRAWTRIGVLVNQLRRLLDAQLSAAVEGVQGGGFGMSGEVIGAMLMLLSWVTRGGGICMYIYRNEEEWRNAYISNVTDRQQEIYVARITAKEPSVQI
jgi:hypothetical protein